MKIQLSLKSFKLIALTAFTGAMISNATAELAHMNPVDEASNPNKLEYKDVEARRPDFSEPFLRDGIITQPQRLQQLKKGLPLEKALALLGQPIKRKISKNSEELDYNLKFKMADSENYIVCQYKLVVDGNQKVIENTVWRRRQCMNMVQH